MPLSLITHIQTDSPIHPVIIETALELQRFSRKELLEASQMPASDVVKLFRLLNDTPELILVEKTPPCRVILTEQGKELLRTKNDRRLQPPQAEAIAAI